MYVGLIILVGGRGTAGRPTTAFTSMGTYSASSETDLKSRGAPGVRRLVSPDVHIDRAEQEKGAESTEAAGPQTRSGGSGISSKTRLG